MFASIAVSPLLAQQRDMARSAFVPNERVVSRAPTAWQAPAKPRSHGARVVLQFLAASAGAAGGGIGTYLLTRDLSRQRVAGDEGYTRSGNAGYLAGSFAGATLGAQLVGRRMGGKAPLWATSLGALVGTVPLASLGIDEAWLPLYGIALGWIPQAAFATAGFEMGERR